MSARKESSVTPDELERILRLAGIDMILIGGQALAFWATYYRTPAPPTAVTKDVDLLGTREDVQRLADGLSATAVFPHRRAQSLLVGQVVKDLPGGDYINIDVMFRVYGDITPVAISDRAVSAQSPVGQFRVMHPLDVLQGRLENVYGLPEKQDEHGLSQLRLAIDVARAFMQDVASRESSVTARGRRPVVLRHFGRLERMALSDAGRKVAQRYDLHVADAIDPVVVQHLEAFATKKVPQLLPLMSATRRVEVQAAFAWSESS